MPAGSLADETALVDALVAGKYGTEDWTVHGRLPGAVDAGPAGAAR